MFLPSNITLKFGDSGDFVTELQRRLAMVRCFNEANVNGFYDGNTVNGVTSFQGREGIHADGVAGPETLRRLNGVVAGDTSGSSDKKEEDVQQAVGAANENLTMVLAAEPDPFAYATTHSPYGEDAYRTGGIEAPVISAPPAPPPVPEASPQQEQQRLNDIVMRDQMLAQQPLSPLDMLAQTQAHTPPQLPPLSGEGQPRLDPLQAQQLHAQQQNPQLTAATEKAAVEKAAAESAAQPKGMVGRAMQFANAMVQKLADYFEAKLPPSVLKEVQSIGLAMAQSGMKENPIPLGPELPTRVPDLPVKGPEQGPQQRA